MSQVKAVHRSEPKCWWCHVDLKKVEPEQQVKSSAPGLVALPAGVTICKEACPQLPTDAITWRAGAEPFAL